MREKYLSAFESLAENGFLLEHMCFEKGGSSFSKEKTEIRLLIGNPKKIILFCELENRASDSAVVCELRGSLNALMRKLSLKMSNFIVFGINDENIIYFNHFNDRLIKYALSDVGVKEVLARIDDEFSYRSADSFENIDEIKNLLILGDSAPKKTPGEKIMVDSDGNNLVYKRGKWYQASDMDSDQLFSLTALGGMLGLHLFYQKKHLKGVVYLLTLGLVGIGWFFDVIEMLFGIYRDPDGKYVLPVSDIKSSLIKFVLGFVFIGILFIAFFTFAPRIMVGVASFIEILLNKGV